MRFKTGTIRSPADPRDYIFSHIYGAVGRLPTRVSLRERCPPVRDQGEYGTCAAFAAEGVKGVQEALNYPGAGYDFSPLFVYAAAKRLDGIPEQEGTYPRTIMKVLKDHGVCSEEQFPYSLMAWPRLPEAPAAAAEAAKKFRIGAYASTSALSEVKHALSRGEPVLAGLIICENFRDDVGPDGMVSLPRGTILGGHAVAVVGYDDQRQALEVRNSWGTSWGDGGYGWVPYDYFSFRDRDWGMPFWMESWTSVDIILPPPAAREVVFWVGGRTALVDGREVALDQPPAIDPASGRALVPLRFLAEHLGYRVDWDGGERKISLIKVGV
ncbi:MAG: hypothetical protein HPY50_04650 [Firmicutes bacterium]|nr:hypothetical protein [Bacillota bacterium]